jgi:hypothetical protein
MARLNKKVCPGCSAAWEPVDWKHLRHVTEDGDDADDASSMVDQVDEASQDGTATSPVVPTPRRRVDASAAVKPSDGFTDEEDDAPVRKKRQPRKGAHSFDDSDQDD